MSAFLNDFGHRFCNWRSGRATKHRRKCVHMPETNIPSYLNTLIHIFRCKISYIPFFNINALNNDAHFFGVFI